MSDIVERMRGATRGLCTENPYDYTARSISAGDCMEAADEIERLRADMKYVADHSNDPHVVARAHAALEAAAQSASFGGTSPTMRSSQHPMQIGGGGGGNGGRGSTLLSTKQRRAREQFR